MRLFLRGDACPSGSGPLVLDHNDQLLRPDRYLGAWVVHYFWVVSVSTVHLDPLSNTSHRSDLPLPPLPADNSKREDAAADGAAAVESWGAGDAAGWGEGDGAEWGA